MSNGTADQNAAVTGAGQATAPALPTTELKIAVLDDFQGVALSCGDWSSIPGGRATAFSDHIGDSVALADTIWRRFR